MTLNELEKKIIHWGIDKTILPSPDAMRQWEKTLEEVYELRMAIDKAEKAIQEAVHMSVEDIARKREEARDEARDAIGDIFVTLVMQCGAWGFSMNECVEAAYTEISGRTGKMVDGQFVKDE